MEINIERDSLVSLWRHLEKQPLTSDDRQRVEEVAVEIYAALQQPEQPKRGRPSGSRNKAKEIDLTAEYLATTPQQNEQRWTSSTHDEAMPEPGLERH
jgi:hypothetical protein